MLDALNFVRGAVSTKDLVPVLTHFAFTGDRVIGFNGRVQISALCKTDFSCTVPAVRLLAALDACGGSDPTLDLRASELCVSARRFRARIATGKISEFPLLQPGDSPSPLGAAWLAVVKRLRPFVASDATRPWACAIHFAGTSAHATNNVILVRCNIPRSQLEYALPTAALDEVLRISDTPVSISVSSSLATIRYAGGEYIVSNLLDGAWPESPRKMLNELITPKTKWKKIPATFAEDITSLRALCGDIKSPMVVFDKNSVATFAANDVNASVTVNGAALGNGTYRVEPLELVLAEATEADWSQFPKVPWRGKGIVGLIAGIKT